MIAATAAFAGARWDDEDDARFASALAGLPPEQLALRVPPPQDPHVRRVIERALAGGAPVAHWLAKP